MSDYEDDCEEGTAALLHAADQGQRVVADCRKTILTEGVVICL